MPICRAFSTTSSVPRRRSNSRCTAFAANGTSAPFLARTFSNSSANFNRPSPVCSSNCQLSSSSTRFSFDRRNVAVLARRAVFAPFFAASAACLAARAASPASVMSRRLSRRGFPAGSPPFAS